MDYKTIQERFIKLVQERIDKGEIPEEGDYVKCVDEATGDKTTFSVDWGGSSLESLLEDLGFSEEDFKGKSDEEIEIILKDAANDLESTTIIVYEDFDDPGIGLGDLVDYEIIKNKK